MPDHLTTAVVAWSPDRTVVRRLMTVADPSDTARIAEFLDHDEVGVDVRQSADWTTDVLRDPVSVERAKVAFGTFVDPAEIARVFDAW
ncbi:hypothetical protein [Ruania alba]|uniref:Uncharacterized protein n=1 Tax=Ruania alba TaxID=648782 RepID=A0A1H5MFC2_9MICO|nr:hypothetical protein [Ruania alba]SEE88169.1 hypothetical protein SAMN04488554_3360 [Ruania alba]